MAPVSWSWILATMTARTSTRSGEMTSMRSMSVFDGAMCRSGISSAVSGSWYRMRLCWESSVSSSMRMPEQFDDGPRPERVFLFGGQVAAFPGVAVFGPDSRAGLFQNGAPERLAAGGELLTGRGGRCRGQAPGPGGALPLRGGGQAGPGGWVSRSFQNSRRSG